MKKAKSLLVLILSAVLCITAGCSKYAEHSESVPASERQEETGTLAVSAEGKEIETVSLKDDFYAAVNAEWLSNHEISADRTNVSTFLELDDNVVNQLLSDFNDFSDGKKEVPKELQEAVKLYGMAKDYKRLDEEGVKPLLPMIEKLDDIENLAEMNDVWDDMVADGYSFPFSIFSSPDFMDAAHRELWLGEPALLLGAKDYYTNEDQKTVLQKVYKDMAVNLLTMAGKTADEAGIIADEALAYDELIAQYLYTQEKKSDVESLYHPISVEELSSEIKNLSFKKLTSSLEHTPDRVILTNDVLFASMDELICDAHFSELKNWMLVNLLVDYAPYLSDEMRVEAGSYNRTLLGVAEADPRDKAAFYCICASKGIFSEPVGIYYGKNYFGEAARDDVTEMIYELIDVYRDRLSGNDWLSQKTIDKAIEKLDNMTIRVAYPDQAASFYELFKVKDADEGGSYLENVLNFGKIYYQYTLGLVGTEVDRNQWKCAATEVNAYYNSLDNSINIPAAILQAPFYSSEQSVSENYGGIGMVIGHEISHAFDPNGAKFDENGSLSNWWTDEDIQEFEKRSDAVIKQYDGVESQSGTVNGTITVGENVADLGGINCALTALKRSTDPDLEAFFASYAHIWAGKMTDEYAAVLLLTDTHSPMKVRVNQLLPNMDDFIETFNIEPDDGMYRAPEERITIW